MPKNGKKSLDTLSLNKLKPVLKICFLGPTERRKDPTSFSKTRLFVSFFWARLDFGYFFGNTVYVWLFKRQKIGLPYEGRGNSGVVLRCPSLPSPPPLTLPRPSAGWHRHSPKTLPQTWPGSRRPRAGPTTSSPTSSDALDPRLDDECQAQEHLEGHFKNMDII